MDRPIFSDMLANRRRQLGYSIGQACRVLRLREDVLIAFEEGDFERMPKSGYAQGMISSYARYLGLDANEVVDAYVRDYEQYRHGGSRRKQRSSQTEGRKSRTGSDPYAREPQPYVAPRGLLPTSGGLAGDLGSFATTRVRSRGTDGADSSVHSEYDQMQPTQQRAYPVRTISRTRRGARTYGGRSSGDIRTMRVDEAGYEDDLRLGRNARPYEAASTGRGRRSSRNLSDTRRPRVDRDRRTTRGSGTSSRRGTRQQQSAIERLLGGSSQLTLLIGVGLVVIISLILVFSVTSCIRNDSESVRTVPVSAASSDAQATEGDDASKDDAQSSSSAEADKVQDGVTGATGTPADDAVSVDTSQGAKSAQQRETSVSVSVADGAVTWLEVECDGKSDIADTITGPWQRTYTVEDALSVQASDTTSVTVVQDGHQLQFDSMASGIGTLRVQGTKVKSTKSSKKAGETATEGSSAKTGNASSSASAEGTGAEESEVSGDDGAYVDGSYDEGYGEYDDSYYG